MTILSHMRADARASQKAFVEWAQQAAIPMPASPEEPLSDKALSVLKHMLEGKSFVFLGEPDHYLIEKFPYRLEFIRNLFELGWHHIGMEMGRSEGWRLDQYIETSDASFLPGSPAVDGYNYRKAFGQMIDFTESQILMLFKQLHGLSEARSEVVSL